MRDERTTRTDLIDPALRAAGWAWDAEHLIGPGRVNVAGGAMYDAEQALRADYLLRAGGLAVAVLEAKAEGHGALDGLQQAERYARRLGLRYALASDGAGYVVLDTETGEFEERDRPPTPAELLDAPDALPARWRAALDAAPFTDQITQKTLRAYQRRAIEETVARFGRGEKRALLLMATGTGKTFTVFQLVWKLVQGGALDRNRVLFLTDRNSLQGQAYRAFAAYPEAARVVIDKATVAAGTHRVGTVFYANYQTLFEEVDGQRLYRHYEPDFFDLVVVDECHRSGFGDWFGVLEHFGSAYQLGLTATPREIGAPAALTPEEARRDTYTYFTGQPDGEPAFTYSLAQAIDDGYLVPYLLDVRTSNVDREGYLHDDDVEYHTRQFERTIRLPDRTRAIAEDLYEALRQTGREDEKAVVFCVDDTHAALFAAELRRISKRPHYAARITRSERNSHQLERNFARVGAGAPRVACTVDLLTTGFDAPDVQHVVFARPVHSQILYKQMKGRGTRLCEDVDKRFFTVWDYVDATRLEDAAFDGPPLAGSGKAGGAAPGPGLTGGRVEPVQRPVAEGVHVEIVDRRRYVCFADGRRIPLEAYREEARQTLRALPDFGLDALYAAWPDQQRRRALRDVLADAGLHVAAFKHYYELDEADDVDVLAKVGYDLARVPLRRDRVARLWTDEGDWLDALASGDERRHQFWETALDHYALFGVDSLERADTYRAPQFVARVGPFAAFAEAYGGAARLRDDLEAVKRHLYHPLAA